MPADPAAAKALFLEAAAIDDPAARAALVSERCGADADLLARVNALLVANDRALANAATASTDTGAAPDGPTADYPGAGEQAGAVIGGKYALVEPIGEGGMGAVWRAKQTEPVKRVVAVKLIKAGMDSRSVVARFEAERQALALMDHPNIAKVLDGGLHDGRPFFVMELVKGVPITDYCDRHKLTPRERLELFVPVCQAIQHAHQKGIIHRDVKPSNVLIALYDDRPVAKVIDFGVAKATGLALTERTIDTGFGGVVGTPEYMSPEQATFNNLDIDTRSDVYALGVLLYELLTGSPPFSRKELAARGLMEMLRVVREEEPPRPSTRLSTAEALPTLSANRGTEPKKLTGLLRNELDWVVMKALEKDRTRRYETANGFAADVQRYLAGEPVAAHPPSTPYRLRKFVRRNRPQVVAAALVLCALVAGVAGTTAGLVRANRAAAEAVEQQRLAEQAVERERQAKVEAERNLAFARKGNEILGSVFAGLDPSKIAESGRPLQDVLRENLATAVKELEGTAVGDLRAVAVMQNRLGGSLLGLGEPGLAVEVFRKALGTYEAEMGPDHPETLALKHNLAVGYRDAGQLDRALPLFEEVLRLRTGRLDPADPLVLESKLALGRGHLDAGDVKRALPLLEETLGLMKDRLGPDHSQTLECMTNLAAAYKESGKPDRVLPLFEEVLRRRTARFGPHHPDTLLATNNLGVGYLAAGKPDRAVQVLEGALPVMTARMGPDHPMTLDCLSNLAAAYQEVGKPDRAVPFLEELLRLRKAKQGPTHPATLVCMNNLAVCYWDTGKLDRALPLLEEALKLMQASLGRDHSDTIAFMDNLGAAYRDAGKFDRALPVLEEALQLSKARFGPDDQSTLTRMYTLGAAYCAAGKGEPATPLLKQFLAGMRRHLAADEAGFAGLQAQAGSALLSAGQFSAAAEVLRACLAAREKAEPDAWTTFNTQSMLGGALLGQRQYAEAGPLLLKGYEGMKRHEKAIPPPGAARIPEAVDRLVEWSTATNRPDEAMKWRAERAKYPPPKEAAPPPPPREKK
jgi:eukaryotic-like serine/threonine-protein kinase